MPFSTGVILEHLPVEKLVAALPAAKSDLIAEGWHAAAHAIMTTDTLAKSASRKIMIDGQSVTLTGMSKGAGMIKPNMATMLGFIATDAGIAQDLLNELVKEVQTNPLTVSLLTGIPPQTTLLLLWQRGRQAIEITNKATPQYQTLRSAIMALAIWLAQAIVLRWRRCHQVYNAGDTGR